MITHSTHTGHTAHTVLTLCKITGQATEKHTQNPRKGHRNHTKSAPKWGMGPTLGSQRGSDTILYDFWTLSGRLWETLFQEFP